MSETMELQESLAERGLADDPPVETKGVARSNAAVDARTPLLDDRHRSLLRELLGRPSWRLAELRTLTSRAGLMPLACVATLNEWATDTYGDLIIEGEEILTVNKYLKQKLKL